MSIHIPAFWLLFLSALIPANAATFTINSNTDTGDHTPGDGLCDWDNVTPGEQCSMRAAIEEANNDGAADIIEVPPRGAGLAWEHTGSNAWCIGNPLIIRGTIYPTRITGTATTTNTIFEASTLCEANPTNIVIENLIIEGGASQARAIDMYFFSSLTIRNCEIRDFQGDGNFIDDTILISSLANGISIESCLITENLVSGVDITAGENRIISSEISHNGRSDLFTAGITAFSLPSSPSRLYITNSLVTNNAGRFGGGLDLRMNTTTFLINTTISDNSAMFSGGGVFVGSAITDTSIGGHLEMYNSTIANNKSDIENDMPLLPSAGVEISTSFSGDDDASALAINSIISGNTQGSQGNEVIADCSGALDSEGYNFIGSTNNCSISEISNPNTDILNQDPMLGPLLQNGGPTRTHTSTSLSVIDGGNTAGCMGDHDLDSSTPDAVIPNDQRGLSRPRNGRCDIGAHEHFVCVENPAELTLSNDTITNAVIEQACTSINVSDSYSIGDNGDLYLRSPLVAFAPGFSIAAGGKLTVRSVIPDS